MDSVERKARMKRVASHAAHLETVTKHDFGMLDGYPKYPSKTAPSPKLSKAGEFYLDCRNCRRSVFDSNTGSAVSSPCER